MFTLKISLIALVAVILRLPFVSGHDRSAPRPLSYDVTLRPYLSNMTFDGEVTIGVEIIRNEKKLTLNSQDLLIKSVGVRFRGEMSIQVTHQTDLEEQRLKMSMDNLLPGNYSIHVAFQGRINNKSVGLFTTACRSGNSQSWIAGAILEPINARSAFPSFDTNENNTQVNMSIILDQSYATITTLPQMRILSSVQLSYAEINLEQIGWAYYPNDQKVRSTLANGHTFVTCRDVKTIDVSQRITQEMNSYTNLQQSPSNWILMPDLPSLYASSMGIIFIREYLMENSSYTNRKDIEENILAASESYAAQLFGEAVRVDSWSDTWLTRGLAKLISYKITDKMLENFSSDSYIVGKILPEVLEWETVPHSLSKHAHSRNDILSMFDQHLHSRAALILRMIEDKVGEDVFRRTVADFASRAMRTGEANAGLFWESLNEQTLDFPPDENIYDVMKPWIHSAGYPVLNVRREKEYLFISQESVIKNASRPSKGYWWVPVTLTSQTLRGPRKFWLRPGGALKVNLPITDKWYMINEHGKGFYRVNYDFENWRNLSDAMRKREFGGKARGRLLDDSLGLAALGRLPYSVPLELTRHLADELDGCKQLLPWSSAIRHLVNIRSLLKDSVKPFFHDYAAALIESYILGESNSISEDDSNESSSAEPTYQVSNTSDAGKILAKMSQVKDLCRDNHYCYDLLNHIRTMTSQNDEDSVGATDMVVCLNVQTSPGNGTSVGDWLELYKQYASPTLESKIIKGLACLPSVEQRNGLLDLIIADSMIKRQDFLAAIEEMSYSEESVSSIITWIMNNINQVYQYISGDPSMLSVMITRFSEKIYTDNEIKKLESLIKSLKELSEGSSWDNHVNKYKIHRALLRMEQNKQSRFAHHQEIGNWLMNRDKISFPSTASSLSQVFHLLLFLLIFNIIL